MAQKIVIEEFGPSESLKIQDFNLEKTLGENDVHIDVHYSGINFADIVMRLGMYKDAPPKPFTPGYEISGIVKQIGDHVSELSVGDKVMAGTVFGGYSSEVIVPKWQVVKLDDKYSLEEAAGVPVNFFTAYLALNEFARVRKGDKILLDCATGGVGIYAIEMAKAVGAEVVGLTSTPSKKDFIKGLGATPYTHEEFYESDEKDFTFILNSSGGKTVKPQYRRLASSGQICCIGLQDSIKNGKTSLLTRIKTIFQTPIFPLLQLVLQSKSVSGFNALSYFENDDWLKKHIGSLKACEIKPHIGGVFEASKIAEAHSFLEQKKARGKVLIKWQ